MESENEDEEECLLNISCPSQPLAARVIASSGNECVFYHGVLPAGVLNVQTRKMIPLTQIRSQASDAIYVKLVGNSKFLQCHEQIDKEITWRMHTHTHTHIQSYGNYKTSISF